MAVKDSQQGFRLRAQGDGSSVEFVLRRGEIRTLRFGNADFAWGQQLP